jgi:hypothetical protein
MLSLVSLCPAAFLGDLPRKMEFFEHVPIQSRATFEYKRGVTEPPKIVPYYRLSLSVWPLSNNKELFYRFRRVKPRKSHTTGSLICAKPTGR